MPTTGSPSSSRRAATSGHLLPVHTWPDLVGSISPALRKRLTGKSTATFRAIDEGLFLELEALVARAFEAYMAPDEVSPG